MHNKSLNNFIIINKIIHSNTISAILLFQFALLYATVFLSDWNITPLLPICQILIAHNKL